MMMFPTLMRTMLSPSDTLKIECEACGRQVAWTRAQAFERLGEGAMPSDVWGRLRCSACGTSRRARTWI
jgi:hypothetical protein